MGCPLATYIKDGGRRRPAPEGRAKCGVLLGLPSPSRIPPPVWNRKEEGKKRRKEGGAPLPSSNSDQTKGRGAATLEALFLLSRMAQ